MEQTRVLKAVRRSAIKARVAAHRQVTSLLVTAPEVIRARFANLLEGDHLITALATTRPGASTGESLRRLTRRHQALSAEITELDAELQGLITEAAPAMLATKGFGVITAATLLVSAGDNPSRLRSEASFAALCGAAPIPASPGKTNRHRVSF